MFLICYWVIKNRERFSTTPSIELVTEKAFWIALWNELCGNFLMLLLTMSLPYSFLIVVISYYRTVSFCVFILDIQPRHSLWILMHACRTCLIL